ncbi:MAG: nucleoside triphosphate pyrophosphohydrolase [bacterium]|nr:nucleoside triphosphate pyrophosphohydrolase [bacterium]
MKQDPFRQLVAILEQLRGPDGCPWDREQTFDSLRPYLLEETYEILETIDLKKYAQLREELGDLLLHIVLQAQIAREEGLFQIDDVLAEINAKLVRRHPHVFGETKVDNTRQVLKNWESIKLEDGDKRVLSGVPKTQPALLRAFRVQEKAAGVGFDWEKVSSVLEKVREEIDELQEAAQHGEQERVEEEFGDLLFSLVNLARFLKVPPEEALRGTVEKFIRRFNYIEKTLLERGKEIQKSTLQEMDSLWDEAKFKGI